MLREQMSFDVPSPRSRLKDPEQYLETQTETVKPRLVLKPFLIAFSSLLVAVVVFLGGYLALTPSVNLTLDINPSFQISLNAFDRIIDIRGKDEQAQAIIDQLDNPHGRLDKVIPDLYEKGIQADAFHADEAYLLFGVAGDNYKKEQRVRTKLLDIKVTEATTVYVINKHSESSETLHFRFASASAPKGDRDNNIDTASKNSVTANYFSEENTTKTVPASSYDSVLFDDMITVFASNYPEGTLTESEYLDLASTLQVSEAKLQMALEVFVFYDEYDSADDLSFLANLDLKDLFELYEKTILP